MASSKTEQYAGSAHIPLQRFFWQVLFSALAVLIPNLLQKWDVLPISGLVAIVCGAYTHVALGFRNPLATSPTPPYCILISTYLGWLHQVTTGIGERALEPSSGFSQTQHIAVHFSLAFFIISEFEFYRACIDFRNFKPGFDPFKYFLKANIDYNFIISHDPWGFGYQTRTEESCAAVFGRANGIHVGQFLLFTVVSGLVNYPIKRVLNPESGARDVLGAMTSANVFFVTHQLWEALLNLVVLLRVLRQANHLAGWAVVGVVEWLRARENSPKRSVSRESNMC